MIFLEKNKVIHSLKSKKYAHIPPEEILIPDTYMNEWNALKNSWQNLRHDEYMRSGDNYRRRAFGKFILNIEENEFLPIECNVFFQNEEINSYAGGVHRLLPRMQEDVKYNRVLKEVVKMSLESFLAYRPSSEKIWSIFVHQFRIEARPGITGHPTPEGVHRDGHKFISMHVINRENIEGGTSYIFNNNKQLEHELTLKSPLESILLNDMEMYHSVSPVSSKKEGIGYRDVMVIDYNEMKQ